MKANKLSKEVIKRFSISYNEAKAYGITDEDLKYISEIGPNKFRISIRVKGANDRQTKVVNNLLDAINKKYDMLKNINKHQEYISKQSQDIKSYLNLTVEDGLKLFFEYRKTLIDKKIVVTTYEKDVMISKSRFITECKFLKKKVINVTTEDAQEFVDDLFNAEPLRETKSGKMSENSLFNPYELMHKLFEYFKDVLKLIEKNPLDDVDRKPVYTPKDRNYLATVDIHYVLNEIDKKNIRFKTLINLYLETGLRMEEILALKFSDINRLRGTIKIVRAVVKSRLTGELIVKDLKTKSSEREISVSTYTLDLIDCYRNFKENSGMLVCEDDYIFTAWEENEMITPSRYTYEWRMFIRSLGYEDLPLRVLRHSAATFMLSGETNLKAVKKRFGWSKDSTVWGIYNQSNLEEDKKLLDKFEAEFRNTLGATYSELYCLCMNRLNNARKQINIMEKILNKSVDKSNMENDLKTCTEYLFELFPVFNKISKIDVDLDDEEIEAMFVGFKPIYKKIKIEPLNRMSNS